LGKGREKGPKPFLRMGNSFKFQNGPLRRKLKKKKNFPNKVNCCQLKPSNKNNKEI